MTHKKCAFIALHIILLIYSISSVCSKLASRQPWGSIGFSLLYGAVLLLFGVYAVCWQQVIKHLSLLAAFSSKAITVVWGMLWGAALFQEKITIGKIVGAGFVLLGIVLFVQADGEVSL